MESRLNPRQLEVLQWIAEGCQEGAWDAGDVTYKVSSVALRNRKLVKLRGRGPNWSATITDVGTYYLAHHEYPEGHPLAPKPPAPSPVAGVNRSEVPSAVKATAEGPSGQTDQSWQGQLTARQKREAKESRENSFAIDSPSSLKARQTPPRNKQGHEPAPHPWEERILVAAKEAAWLLSVSESIIRKAVRDGDVERVFIGEGTKNYRIVHASLLAWVNSLPTSSPRYYG